MAAIVITDIVTDDLEGDGSFDKLMSAVELRLKHEYDHGRIMGSDYATVYLGAIQSVLQQSIAFTLGVQQADKQADLVTQQILLATEQTSLVTGQITKTTSEEELLDQKKFTEQAQILDTVDGNAVAGVIGKQKTLYTNQSTGFTRDAEIKAAKVFTDLWTIAKSTSPDDLELALPFNLDQASMDAVLLKIAENGIGMTEAELGTQSAEYTTNGISAATDPGAAEVIITTDSAHGLTTGDAVSITGVVGMTELNGNNYIITVTASTTFTLDNTDGVSHTAYTSGGVVTQL